MIKQDFFISQKKIINAFYWRTNVDKENECFLVTKVDDFVAYWLKDWFLSLLNMCPFECYLDWKSTNDIPNIFYTKNCDKYVIFDLLYSFFYFCINFLN